MKKSHYLVILSLFTVFVCGFSQSKLILSNKPLVVGEVLKYKAKWGFITIGSATTIIDRKIYRFGSNVCYKVQLSGETNGMAKLFYLRDRWSSFIDVNSITTYKSFRSIREGNYKLDEMTYFDRDKKNAKVLVLDQNRRVFVLKKNYKTPENIRDVVAGFMLIRLIDLSKYAVGDTFTVDGFYFDEGYKINVIYEGKEYIDTEKGKVLCYKVKPLVPKNHVFDDVDAVDVWVSADKAQLIMYIHVKLILGNLVIELEK